MTDTTMDTDHLTDEDRAVLGSLEIDGELDHADGIEDVKHHVNDLRGEIRGLRDENAELKARFNQLKSEHEARFDQLEATIDALDAQPVDDEPETQLDRYVNIPEDEREDLLSTSEHIALTLHTNWDDIAWVLGTAQNRKSGVDTKTKANAKYSPSQLKHRLKPLLGYDPYTMQIYRGLKRLAVMSGGEEVVNSSDNRVHVRGGRYEYREMTTADNQDTKRVVWRADE